MSTPKVSFEDSLRKNVVDTGKCVGCSACIVVCPFNCLEYVDEEPKVVKECKVCGICAQACPRYYWDWSKAENFVFGRERKPEEDFGVYRKLVVAQAKNDDVLRACQDGGVVTALLLFALENGFIDGAVVSALSQEKPFHPIPKLAVTREEILESAGTKYSYSPNIQALAEVAKQKKSSLAFVGTPCQIHAIRKMQMAGLKRYTAPIKFLIGLMCSESFYYEGLMQKHIQEKLGINLNAIKKMNIKGKMLITTEKGVKAIALSEIKQYARRSCSFCDDFSSELADISTGGLGLDKWTFTIIRTEKGEDLFSKADKAGILNVKAAETEANALNLLTKLSRKKRGAVKTP
jgi:coenzyme F420 hydrogenase subunit beta